MRYQRGGRHLPQVGPMVLALIALLALGLGAGPATTAANAVVLGGGNIIVPH